MKAEDVARYLHDHPEFFDQYADPELRNDPRIAPLLQEVRVGWEIWRQLNGFPPIVKSPGGADSGEAGAHNHDIDVGVMFVTHSLIMAASPRFW